MAHRGDVPPKVRLARSGPGGAPRDFFVLLSGVEHQQDRDGQRLVSANSRSSLMFSRNGMTMAVAHGLQVLALAALLLSVVMLNSRT